MEKTLRDHLVAVLEELESENLKKFKAKLNEIRIPEGYDNIPHGKLEEADALDLARLLVQYYTEANAGKVAVAVLNAINCKQLASRLSAL